MCDMSLMFSFSGKGSIAETKIKIIQGHFCKLLFI